VVATEESLRFRTTVILVLLAAAIGAYAYLVERPARQREAAKQTLLTLDSDDVEGVTLAYPDRQIRLAKNEDGRWQIRAPLQMQADQSAVTNLVNAITGAEMARTIEKPSRDLSLYGLDEPTVTIRLHLKDGTDSPTLIVGKETPIGFKAYVQKEGDPNVYLTTGAFHSGVRREVRDLRDKTIMAFTDDEVESITLKREAARTVVLRRDPQGIWSITDPRDYAADTGEVRSFLSSLRGLRAQDFLDDPADDLARYGLDAPRLLVTLSSGDQSASKSLLLGSEAPGTPKRIYAKRGDGDTIYLLGDWVIQTLDYDLDKFRDRTVLPFDPERATQIRITRKQGESLTLERLPGGPWTLAGTEAAPKESAIKRFVDDLRQTKPTEIVSEDVTDFPRYGLHDPDLRISVVAEDGNPIGTLLAARHREAEDAAEEFYFAREDMPTIFKGHRYMFTNLDKAPRDLLEAPTTPSAEGDRNGSPSATDG